jgi:5-formyltetrahydrofolate cyclo-ligase
MTLPRNPAKALLRRQMRQALAAMSPDLRRSESLRACETASNSTVWRQARTPLLYAPLPEELDVSPLWSAALAEGKTLCLPRYNPDGDDYSAALVSDLARDLIPGHYGVREPASACPLISLNLLDFVLVPGLAFGPDGRRLGRGKGYYDRLLAGLSALKCGIGFDLQWSEWIPQEPCDVLLDCILTPGRGFVWSPDRF